MLEQSSQHNEIKKYGNGIVVDLSSLHIDDMVFAADAATIILPHAAAGRADTYVMHASQPGIIPFTIQKKKDHAKAAVTIIIEEQVSVTLAETIDAFAYIELTVNLILKKGARCTYVAAGEQTATHRAIQRNAIVHEAARMVWVDIVQSGQTAQSHIASVLQEPHASSHTYGIFLGSDSQLFDMSHITTHAAENTESRMITHGVLDHAAKTVYRSNIRINQGAKQAQGQQKLDVLLLSPKTEIDAIPDLDIRENAVSCSHGVSMSRPQPEETFYLGTRGVDTEDAITIMRDAKVQSLLQMLSPDVQAYLCDHHLVSL